MLDFDPTPLIGKTIKSVEELAGKGDIARQTDTTGLVITCTDGTRFELGASMGQGCGYIISEVIEP